MSDELYPCPICKKPFDMRDKLADFALSAHMKDHQEMRPENLLEVKDGELLCSLCQYPMGSSMEMARISMAGHMRQHGIETARPAGAARGSGLSWSRGPEISRKSFGDLVEDVVEGFVAGVVWVFTLGQSD